MGRRRLFASVGLVLAVLAAGCGDDGGGGDADSPTTTAGASTTTATPKSGGTLTIGTFSETPGFDPVTNVGTGVNGGMELTALYDSLMTYDTATGKQVGSTVSLAGKPVIPTFSADGTRAVITAAGPQQLSLSLCVYCMDTLTDSMFQ